jgi:hypothetical protein
MRIEATMLIELLDPSVLNDITNGSSKWLSQQILIRVQR